MGLDFIGAKAHWAYSGFNRFRERLAQEARINLSEMQGFKTKDGTKFGTVVKGKSWDKINDPIKYLLNHSDCEGQISSQRCGLIIPRIKELIKNWDDNDYDKQEALKLVNGMEDCFLNKNPLIFS